MYHMNMFLPALSPLDIMPKYGNIADYSTNLAYIGKGQYSIVLIGGMLATLFIGSYNINIFISFFHKSPPF